MEYINDVNGKWAVDGVAKILIEPSEQYKLEIEAQEQQRLEDEANKPLTKEQELENEVISLRAMIENLVGGGI